MFRKIKWGGVALASALLVGSLGFATPALADGSEYEKTDLSQAYLTKVIVAPTTQTNIENDQFTFTFTPVTEGDDADSTVSASDYGTAQISSLTVKGKSTKHGDSSADTTDQSAIKVPLSYVLDGYKSSGVTYPSDVTEKVVSHTTRTAVTFPHAGVYTYEVVESNTVNSNADGTRNINSSNASYLMRVYVKNGSDGKTVVNSVTVEKTKDDEGTEPTGNEKQKVDSSKPDVGDDGDVTDKTNTPDTTKLAGDDRGRNVEGFTFANEYVGGDEVIVAKEVAGDYGDKTKQFSVTFAVTDNAAPLTNAAGVPNTGTIITYYIKDAAGKEVTDADRYNNADGSVASYLSAGSKLIDSPNGATIEEHASNAYEHYVLFKDVSGDHVANVQADLAHGEKIVITGLYGRESTQASGTDSSSYIYRRRQTKGLKATTKYVVTEEEAENYTPSISVYKGHAKGTTAEATMSNGGTGQVYNNGAYVEITNTFDDNSVTPTGIFINNLPYILMIGIPVVVFVGMFVNKRRSSGVAA